MASIIRVLAISSTTETVFEAFKTGIMSWKVSLVYLRNEKGPWEEGTGLHKIKILFQQN